MQPRYSCTPPPHLKHARRLHRPPGDKPMSGEAGAQLDSEYYALFVGSGVRVSYALPPGGDGTEIGRYFQEESAPYARWLERARPALDGFFTRLATEQRIPLVRLSEPSEEIYGIIIEDVDPAL